MFDLLRRLSRMRVKLINLRVALTLVDLAHANF